MNNNNDFDNNNNNEIRVQDFTSFDDNESSIVEFIQEIRDITKNFQFSENLINDSARFGLILEQNSLENLVNVIFTTGDGNCFYRALSILYFGRQDKHQQFRIGIIFIVNKYIKYFSKFLKKSEQNRIYPNGINQFLNDHTKPNTEACEIIVQAAAIMCMRPVISYCLKDRSDDRLEVQLGGRFEYSPNKEIKKKVNHSCLYLIQDTTLLFYLIAMKV